MSQEYHAVFPVQVSPRLHLGKIYKMQITTAGVIIATWPGLYGNKESQTVLEIASEQIVSARYHPPALAAGEGKCKFRYRDDEGRELGLTLNIVDQALISGNFLAQSRQNGYTESLAKVLCGIQQGLSPLPDLPSLTLKVPNARTKLLYGIGVMLFGALLSIGSAGFDYGFLGFFGPFLLCMSFGAVCVDYVRVHTAWHPLVKLLISIVVIFIVLVMFFGMMLWFESLGWI